MDIRKIPFSCRGSYLAISHCCENYRGYGNREGLWLRTVSGAAPTPFVMRFQVLDGGRPTEFRTHFNGLTLRLIAACGEVRFEFAAPETLVCCGNGETVGLRMDEICTSDSCNYLHPVVPGDDDVLCVNCYKNFARYLLLRRTGTMEPFQIWDREEAHECRVDIHSVEGRFQFAIREFTQHLDLTAPLEDLCDALQAQQRDFLRFVPELSRLPEEYREAARTSAYVQWVSLVAPRDKLHREAMLMSKYWMTSVWSWDHCFNALALCETDPELAWEQFLIPFDHQSPDGGLPDFVNDTTYFFNCVKPPIHGWTLKRMMNRMKLSPHQMTLAYDKLSAWTRWWFTQRDLDHDDLCEYWHGNDSGWDNSTVFAQGPCVISPDLNAFLVVQMDVLQELAVQLGRTEDAALWKRQSQKTCDAMVRTLFFEGLPVAIDAVTRRVIPNESLLPYLSLLAGPHLPKTCRDRMLAVLESTEFLTPYGYATEKTASPAFEENGYWRGAVWAPAMYLLFDALKEAGAHSAARKAAECFCRAVAVGGPAENHSALTGEGLRDPAYTWSASVFLLFVKEDIL